MRTMEEFQAEKKKEVKYTLIMSRKYDSSDNWWTRAFGPFETRAKAMGFKKKQLRHIKKEYLWDDEKIAENFKWQVVQIWSEKFATIGD